MNPVDALPAKEEMRAAVERILRSETLRTSKVLQRLLRFLADQSLSGKADELKEYTIALEALGKAATYDPRHDSAVRIQVARLRQKIAEYYRTEGKADPVVVDLPKGRFRLTCESSRPADGPTVSTLSEGRNDAERIMVWVAGLMSLTLLIAVAWASYSTFELWHLQSSVAPGIPGKKTPTSGLAELWQPFLATNKPLIVAIEDPLFAELHRGSGVFYRDRSLNNWTGVLNSSGMTALRRALKDPDVEPSQYYTAFGGAHAAFLLGRLLGARGQGLSPAVVKSSELSWQELADNNALFVGAQAFFDAQLRAMPISLQLVPTAEGIRNLRPNPGEPETFSDQYSTAPSEQGEAYALVTHLPGPLGNTDVESFTSNRAAGYVGAVEWFTDPNFAQLLVAKLRTTSGQIPRYYQVLLKVRFKDGVPTETSYVLSRELR